MSKHYKLATCSLLSQPPWDILPPMYPNSHRSASPFCGKGSLYTLVFSFFLDFRPLCVKNISNAIKLRTDVCVCVCVVLDIKIKREWCQRHTCNAITEVGLGRPRQEQRLSTLSKMPLWLTGGHLHRLQFHQPPPSLRRPSPAPLGSDHPQSLHLVLPHKHYLLR